MRKKRWTGAYSRLLQESGLELEHPLISQLHNKFVANGDWAKAIELVSNLAQRKFIRKPATRVFWKHRLVHSEVGVLPPKRQNLCLDHKERAIFTFGGRDQSPIGNRLFRYSILEGKWSMLPEFFADSDNSELVPDGYCKIVMDNVDGCIFFLGRKTCLKNGNSFVFSDSAGQNSGRTQLECKDVSSPFYKYFIHGPNKGTLICIEEDTRVGLPLCLYSNLMIQPSLVCRRTSSFMGSSDGHRREETMHFRIWREDLRIIWCSLKLGMLRIQSCR